jgi:KDO2-lipid IV(A) lauroyltransferase
MPRLSALLVLGLLRGLAWLPLPAQRRVGVLVGRGLWRVAGEAARVTRINVDRCFPASSLSERETLARMSLIHTAQNAAEAGVLFYWPEARWRALAVRVAGEHHIQDAQRARRGVLILVPHFGNWEYLALYLGKYGLTALYDPPRLRGIETPLQRARSRSGSTLVPISVQGIRAVYQALAAGGVVALLPDQVPARSAGVYAPFFGNLALTMTFAQRLIRKTRPLVLMGSARRVAGGFALRFTPVDPAIAAADPVRSAACMNQCIEAEIRRDPAQYQWEYKRFRRPPPGTADCYRVSRSG